MFSLYADDFPDLKVALAKEREAAKTSTSDDYRLETDWNGQWAAHVTRKLAQLLQFAGHTEALENEVEKEGLAVVNDPLDTARICPILQVNSIVLKLIVNMIVLFVIS